MSVTVTSILNHINKELPYVWILITSGTFLAGLFFAFSAILSFKTYAEKMGGKWSGSSIAYFQVINSSCFIVLAIFVSCNHGNSF